jgi:hypothetical protein
MSVEQIEQGKAHVERLIRQLAAAELGGELVGAFSWSVDSEGDQYAVAAAISGERRVLSLSEEDLEDAGDPIKQGQLERRIRRWVRSI